VGRQSLIDRPTAEPSALERVPPQNLEAEQAVLGSMLLEEEAVVRALEVLEEPCFYKPAHQKIFSAINELYRKDSAIDLVTVTAELTKQRSLEDVGGPSYLAGLTAAVPTAANISHYCTLVKEKYILRRIIDSTQHIQYLCFENSHDPDQLLDGAESAIFEIANKRLQRDAIAVKDIVKSSIDLIDKLYQRKGMITGVPTGYVELDQLLAGLQASDLVIVAGRPAMGKSSFALCIAENVALLQKKAVAIFSLEMSKESLVQRMLCSHARINAHNVRTGMLSNADWPNLTQAAGKLSEAQIFIEDTPGMSVLEMRSKARRLKRRHDIGLVIVDYLQLMDPSSSMKRFSDNRQQEISDISRGLKAMARQLGVPVIAVSQLSRAPEKELRRPRLSDLRESGAIEQDADVVLMLFREEYYNPTEENKGIAEVIIAKQRNGPTDTVKLTFIKEYTRFESMAKE
jgi:replicative DNA helicase